MKNIYKLFFSIVFLQFFTQPGYANDYTYNFPLTYDDKKQFSMRTHYCLDNNIDAKRCNFILNNIISDRDLLSFMYSNNERHAEIVMPGGTMWPGNNKGWVPKMNGTPNFINVKGFLNNPTYFQDDASETSVLNFGDGVSGSVEGTNWDGPGIVYSRVNTTNDPSNRPMITFEQINNGNSNNSQGSEVLRVLASSTPKSKGNMDGLRTYLRSAGNNYAGSFDVNHWSNTQTYGTNWAWDNVQEFGIVTPFACPPVESGDSNYCIMDVVNEEDFNGAGGDDIRAGYNPSKSIRNILGLGLGYDGMNGGSHVTWKPFTKYIRYQIIIAKNSIGRPYMFQALSNKYPYDDIAISAYQQPKWTFNAGDKIIDGNITWTCLGPFHFDVGHIITVSGGNDPQKGWITRFGTLLSTDTVYCYNALIDFSTAVFDPSVLYKIAMRIKPDVYFDFSSQATAETQNLHLLGYSSANKSLEYKFKGENVFSIDDSGKITLEGAFILAKRTKSQILNIKNPIESMSYYDVDDHAQVTYRCITGRSCAWYPVEYGKELN